jgi:hypothetical protein
MADKRLQKCREVYKDDLTINPPKLKVKDSPEKSKEVKNGTVKSKG